MKKIKTDGKSSIMPNDMIEDCNARGAGVDARSESDEDDTYGTEKDNLHDDIDNADDPNILEQSDDESSIG